MKMLSERTPGELFDDPIRLKRLWQPEDCWKCGAKIGELHAPGCSFDFCRRSGIQNFGERPCFCDMGPCFNYLTGERINAKKTNAGRIDPPGLSRTTATETVIVSLTYPGTATRR